MVASDEMYCSLIDKCRKAVITNLLKKLKQIIQKLYKLILVYITSGLFSLIFLHINNSKSDSENSCILKSYCAFAQRGRRAKQICANDCSACK